MRQDPVPEYGPVTENPPGMAWFSQHPDMAFVFPVCGLFAIFLICLLVCCLCKKIEKKKQCMLCRHEKSGKAKANPVFFIGNSPLTNAEVTFMQLRPDLAQKLLQECPIYQNCSSHGAETGRRFSWNGSNRNNVHPSGSQNDVVDTQGRTRSNTFPCTCRRCSLHKEQARSVHNIAERLDDSQVELGKGTKTHSCPHGENSGISNAIYMSTEELCMSSMQAANIIVQLHTGDGYISQTASKATGKPNKDKRNSRLGKVFNSQHMTLPGQIPTEV